MAGTKPSLLPGGVTHVNSLQTRRQPLRYYSTYDSHTGQHTVTLAALDTAAWAAGRATLFVFVERTVAGPATERVSLETKTIDIAANLATATTFDGRTANAKALDDLKAALASYCTAGQGPVAEYQIGDRRMKFRSTTEIADLIAYYERAVAIERGVSGRVFYRG